MPDTEIKKAGDQSIRQPERGAAKDGIRNFYRYAGQEVGMLGRVLERMFASRDAVERSGLNVVGDDKPGSFLTKMAKLPGARLALGCLTATALTLFTNESSAFDLSSRINDALNNEVYRADQEVQIRSGCFSWEQDALSDYGREMREAKTSQQREAIKKAHDARMKEIKRGCDEQLGGLEVQRTRERIGYILRP